ncbi:4-hydroxythreonine-4-phosphate dehydrogenase PdxA [Maritimibacter sp. DP1N21-5]|uniref:4-hydroxythreonine-4-phosphate dehydrogenase PdxA n=1 Tax=Maritimibacter sp. DP1N21-5 TaxID=2836867 RepID=UPI001C4847AA|nr:4-hydroxythreonine-4-phosphate dehydrogenase PdxA [Maritimibacter sp. DP1N21-5]MBV7409506.1 4-hydroxythreonine-4-phosphate dehydrogenase PdxA [Maritimibacter sp. DP1N21-5]
MSVKPIAVSIGEPAGIGPEIISRGWERLAGEVDFFVIGDARHIDGPVVRIAHPDEAATAMSSGVPVFHRDFGPARTPGEAQPPHARHVIDAIREGVTLALSGAASALVTAPIHKKALKDGAGFTFPGHTEYLAHLAGVDDVVMMLACPELRVVPATIHIPLAEVPSALTRQGLATTIRITHAALREQGFRNPRIAIAGLNPHAGEGGAMGREEIEMIAPLIADLRAEGLALVGPLPADTMFHAKAREGYDVAICMYHDQALVPIKTIDFAGGVNVTLGLPFVRTSPDHGTAFDIAGTGRADPTSFMAALRMARDMSAKAAS